MPINCLKRKLYLKQEIINSSHNLRNFWCIMKASLSYKSSRSFPNYIHVDGQKIDTSLGIAENFYNHFCKIGNALAEKVKSSNMRNF